MFFSELFKGFTKHPKHAVGDIMGCHIHVKAQTLTWPLLRICKKIWNHSFWQNLPADVGNTKRRKVHEQWFSGLSQIFISGILKTLQYFFCDIFCYYVKMWTCFQDSALVSLGWLCVTFMFRTELGFYQEAGIVLEKLFTSTLHQVFLKR